MGRLYDRRGALRDGSGGAGMAHGVLRGRVSKGRNSIDDTNDLGQGARG